MKTLAKATNAQGTTMKLVRDAENQEYLVRVYRGDKLQPEEDYFTDDLQDARDTMALMLRTDNKGTGGAPQGPELTPVTTKTCYKLFRTLKTRPGELFPLFIGTKVATPVGQWIPAQFIPTAGFAHRPGWHVGCLPVAKHLMRKDGTMAKNRVWAQVEIPADVNWQPVADSSKTKDIPGRVPEGGFYRFKRPARQGGEWLIAGALKVVKVLTSADVDAVLTSGVEV